METSFSPSTPGDTSGILRIETANQNPSLRNLEEQLLGTGWGPDIQVAPEALDFGRVALIGQTS